MIVRIFAPSVLAKPLNNAQMCEAFFVFMETTCEDLQFL